MSDTPRNLKVLPPKYYLHDFEYLLNFVEQRYAFLMQEQELAFIKRFRLLPENARCVFVRMANRVGTFFRQESLYYNEIQEVESAIATLIDVQYVSWLTPQSTVDIVLFLNTFTKPELLQLSKRLAPVIEPDKKIKKKDLIRWLAHTYTPKELLSESLQIVPLLQVHHMEKYDLFKFLFFGNRHDDMKEFVIRDLGHINYQHFDESSFTLRFHSRLEVDEAFLIATQRNFFYTSKSDQLPEDLYSWFVQWIADFPTPHSAMNLRSYEKLITEVAHFLEKQKRKEYAFLLYQLSNFPPSRERQIRILVQKGSVEEAMLICKSILASPSSIDELYFAQDTIKKLTTKQKRIIKSTTQALKEADTLPLPTDAIHRVEQGAITYYQSIGYHAQFSENMPWRFLFGLLFWDIIYDSTLDTLHNPFQIVPSDFSHLDFYNKRKSIFDKQIATLTSKEELISQLMSNYTQYSGTANVLVYWSEDLLQLSLKIIDLLSIYQITSILTAMAIHIKDRSKGFPDILIWNEDSYRFLEIKSPTDHLSATQLFWIDFFRKHSINIQIMRIVWE